MVPLENGPYNLLSLDGGGIRGVSELVILHRIMERIQKKENLAELPKPCDYFHLIGGTSTGGLVALLVGRLRMSTQEALDIYNELAASIFRRRNMRLSLSSRFGEEPLAKAVRDLVKKINANEMMQDPADEGHHRMGRSFVCALPAQNQRAPKRIRGYISDDDWDRDIKIWEAARATTAAPSYFKPMIVKSGTRLEELIDAAMGFNNPTSEVLDEAMEILDPSCKLGCVVSLGTGTREKHLKGSFTRTLQAVKLMKNVTTDSDRVEDEVKKMFARIPSTYFRFSVPNAAAVIGMTKYKKMDELKEMTKAYLDSVAEEDIEMVADVLSKRKTQGWVLGNLVPNEKYSRVDKARANSGGKATRFFTGREEILQRLSLFFEKRENNPVPRREFLLYGMGGVGKTQIALKFRQLMDAEERFKHIFFVDATDEATIEECYMRISAEQGFQDNNISRVLHWMATTKDEWLLILDNCPDEDFSRFLPDSFRGNILYTSRRSVMKREMEEQQTLEVEVMGEPEAVDLLLKVSHQPLASEEHRTQALPIVKELGCLPLAIEQAGASISLMRHSLKEYLSILVKQKSQMLSGSLLYSAAQPQEKGVYATFDVSYNELRSLSKRKKGSIRAEHAEMAIKILNVICFYHNEHIFEDIFDQAADIRGQLPPGRKFDLGSGRFRLDSLVEADEEGDWISERFRYAVTLLESLSLVRRDDRTQSLSMHVLVHSWARDRMSEAERTGYSAPARTLLLISISSWDEGLWDIKFRRRVYPHILACQRNVKARGEPFVEIQHHAAYARLLQAISLEQAYKEWKIVLSECTPEVTGDDEARWMPMVQLVEVCGELGKYEEAKEIAKALVREKFEKYGETHEKTLAAIFKLVTVCKLMKNIPQMQRFCQVGYHYCRLNGSSVAMEMANVFKTTFEIATNWRKERTLLHRDIQLEHRLVDDEELRALVKANTDKDKASGEELQSAREKRAELIRSLWESYDWFAAHHGPYCDEARWALTRLVHDYLCQGQVTCANIIAKEGMERCQKYFGEFHNQTIDFKSLIGLVWCYDGRSREAVALQRECIDQSIEAAGSDSEYTNILRFRLEVCEIARKNEEQMLRKLGEKMSKMKSPKAARPEGWDGERLSMEDECDNLPCGKSGHRELLERLKVVPDAPKELLDAFGGIDQVWRGDCGSQKGQIEGILDELEDDPIDDGAESGKKAQERDYLALSSHLKLKLLSKFKLDKQEDGFISVTEEETAPDKRRGRSKTRNSKDEDNRDKSNDERNSSAGKIDRKGKRPEVVINLVGNYVK